MVVIDGNVLENFGACQQISEQFVKQNPNGLDISGLWGTAEESTLVWAVLFASEWKRQIGWAILVGLLPARIRADLREADLTEADLSGAKLSGADLSWAILCEADLHWADLCEAKLRGADLSRAKLAGADLRGADLRGTDLRGADLREADLRWADLYGAEWNDATLWPEGFTPERIGDNE